MANAARHRNIPGGFDTQPTKGVGEGRPLRRRASARTDGAPGLAPGLAVGIAALRVGIGLTMLARPELVPRLLGVDRVTAGRLRWLGLMVGGRDLGLGVGVLASGAATSRAWLLTQALVDGVDMVALLTAARRGAVAPLSAGAFAATAVAAAATEVRLAVTTGATDPVAGRGDRRAGERRNRRVP